MTHKTRDDGALENKGGEGPSKTFLEELERDGDIVKRDRINVGRGVDGRPLKRPQTNDDIKS